MISNDLRWTEVTVSYVTYIILLFVLTCHHSVCSILVCNFTFLLICFTDAAAVCSPLEYEMKDSFPEERARGAHSGYSEECVQTAQVNTGGI